MSLLDELRSPLPRLAKEAKNVRVLTLDIESKPMLSWHWGLWDQNISIAQIVEHGGMMCFAAKWMGEKDIMFFSEWGHGKEAMVKAIHDLLSEADIVVGYNSDRYDIKRLNNEFLDARLGPPKPYKSIDLMKVNKGRFDLPSKKLDYLAQRSGVGQKTKHQGFDLWTECMAGDVEARALMEKYNKQDVRITEKAYLALLPWMVNTPHIGMFTRDEFCCPYCGSTKLRRDDFTHTNVQSYRLFECKNCGGWVRGNTTQQDPTHTRATR